MPHSILQGRYLRVYPGDAYVYPFSGGDMDYWYTDRMPIDAVITNDPDADWPVFLWNRQPLTIYTGA